MIKFQGIDEFRLHDISDIFINLKVFNLVFLTYRFKIKWFYLIHMKLNLTYAIRTKCIRLYNLMMLKLGIQIFKISVLWKL